MGFTNSLANNEEDLQDEGFYYNEEDSVEECEHFKILSLEKFNEEGITLNVIPSLRFIGETLDIEMVIEAENTTVSTVIKGISKSYVCPVCSKIYKAELHYVKHSSKCDKSISTSKFSKFIKLIKFDLTV